MKTNAKFLIELLFLRMLTHSQLLNSLFPIFDTLSLERRPSFFQRPTGLKSGSGIQIRETPLLECVCCSWSEILQAWYLTDDL